MFCKWMVPRLEKYVVMEFYIERQNCLFSCRCLFVIGSIELDEEVTVVEEAECDNEDNHNTSLLAIEGVERTTSMRIKGYVGWRTLQILIDNGSTHDFLDYDLAKRLCWKENGAELSSVELVGVKRLKAYGMWKNFKWKMQCEDFTFDLRMMLLILRENHYFVKKSVWTFVANKLEYLGHIISNKRVSTNPKQIQAISDWPKPTNMK